MNKFQCKHLEIYGYCPFCDEEDYDEEKAFNLLKSARGIK